MFYSLFHTIFHRISLLNLKVYMIKLNFVDTLRFQKLNNLNNITEQENDPKQYLKTNLFSSRTFDYLVCNSEVMLLNISYIYVTKQMNAKFLRPVVVRKKRV